ncbi:MAG TPA: hypothetical protein PK733_17915, partial [Clostridiales bacterium]|nr:hypothetical protein [Clostridiales bacterium]
MLKKIISMLIIVILVTGIFLTVGPLTPNPISPQTVTAEDLRGGFQLIPESMDSTGVKPDSSYMLKS